MQHAEAWEFEELLQTASKSQQDIAAGGASATGTEPMEQPQCRFGHNGKVPQKVKL